MACLCAGGGLSKCKTPDRITKAWQNLAVGSEAYGKVRKARDILVTLSK